MLEVSAQAFLLFGAAWLLWKLVRSYVYSNVLSNLPGPPSESFVYGNLKQLYNPRGWDFHRELGEKYGHAVQLRGRFGRKMLYTFDTKAMHHIAVKEQYIYDEARWFLGVNSLTLGPGLLATTGEQHRRQRKILNPAFNINHMRNVTPIFQEVAGRLQRALQTIVGDSPKEIDMSKWMGRTALELIGLAGLGYSFDSLVEDRPDTLGEAMKSFVPALYALSKYLQFYPYIEACIPRAVRAKAAEWLPHKKFQRIRALTLTMNQRSKEILDAKKAALERGDEALKCQVAEGKDLMSLLLRANMNAEAADKLSEDELIGQMSTLTVAAVDTTSSALSMILHLLAKNPRVQDKLRDEIRAARDGGKDIEYDTLVSLPYLDAVCRETLRLYPMAPYRFRETREDVVLPLSEPVRGLDGSLISEIPLPKGTMVFVGIMSANTSKKLWGPDAHEWKPERWLAPLPEAVLEAKIPGVYANLMTFWGGGRACIGFKFSQLEMKVVLSTLLSTFTFALTEENSISWNLAGVIYPTAGEENKPSLPLRVGLAKA
ncbi:cytochrome P450 [Trametes coccinea BRFM310]|uniref:Cytochrome P450 n=1 Tax=Trametes coccinea (strain BRFM310) TaxID=1353009 RepID=A0A1Y2IVQ1_TRAC3|nr:cytochrome P450 [Trametes coccinea BRFM310]